MLCCRPRGALYRRLCQRQQHAGRQNNVIRSRVHAGFTVPAAAALASRIRCPQPTHALATAPPPPSLRPALEESASKRRRPSRAARASCSPPACQCVRVSQDPAAPGTATTMQPPSSAPPPPPKSPPKLKPPKKRQPSKLRTLPLCYPWTPTRSLGRLFRGQRRLKQQARALPSHPTRSVLL